MNKSNQISQTSYHYYKLLQCVHVCLAPCLICLIAPSRLLLEAETQAEGFRRQSRARPQTVSKLGISNVWTFPPAAQPDRLCLPLPRVVKEEISDDNAKLPCFNGRVVSWVSVTDDSPAGPTFQLRHQDERPCRSCKCGRVTPPQGLFKRSPPWPSLQKRCRLIQLVCKAYGNRLGFSHSAGTLLASTVCSSFTVNCNYEDKECGQCPLGSSRLRQIKSSRHVRRGFTSCHNNPDCQYWKAAH